MKCHFCSNSEVKYCNMCKKYLCESCRKNYPRRVKGFFKEKFDV